MVFDKITQLNLSEIHFFNLVFLVKIFVVIVVNLQNSNKDYNE